MKINVTGEGGKGSTPRGTDHKKYTDGWEKIFGNKQKDKKDADKSNNK